MSVTIAHVPTEYGSRYLQQLCKHWAHKLEVSATDDTGSVTFPDGSALAMTASAETLALRLDVPDGGDAAKMQHVVQEHLDRFAFREAPLAFDWRPA